MPGQVVEMSVNIRALLMGSLRNVVLRMDSLTMHDCYGAGVCFFSRDKLNYLLMGIFVQLLAEMNLSKHASPSEETVNAPRKRKVGISDIVVSRGVRPCMENMSLSEDEGEGGGESPKMVL